MKKSFFCLILLSRFLIHCTSQEIPAIPTQQALLQQFAQSPDIVKMTKNSNGIILYKEGFCANNDCQQLFSDLDIPVTVYSRAGLFMRAIDHYVQINNIEVNAQQSSIQWTIRNKNQYKNGKISL